ncbi:MAG TPA: hypothetical protein VGE50_00880 [Gammaproteobacteria bacterium]
MEQHSTIEMNLHQTIAHIESRLAAMSGCGDCAYENALAHSYRELLVGYGRKLFLLQSRRFLLSEPSALVTQAKTE